MPLVPLRRLRQLELHRALGHVLHHHRAVRVLTATVHIPYPQAHQVAAVKLAVDGEVEQRKLPHRVRRLKVDAHGPDFLGPERGFWPISLPLFHGSR